MDKTDFFTERHDFFNDFSEFVDKCFVTAGIILAIVGVTFLEFFESFFYSYFAAKNFYYPIVGLQNRW